MAKIVKRQQIEVSFDTALYLHNLGYEQRLGKKREDKSLKSLVYSLKHSIKNNGFINIEDKMLGGAREDGTWVSWSIKDIKNILDKKGYEYHDIDSCEVILL